MMKVTATAKTESSTPRTIHSHISSDLLFSDALRDELDFGHDVLKVLDVAHSTAKCTLTDIIDCGWGPA